jgi:hypothetical protein
VRLSQDSYPDHIELWLESQSCELKSTNIPGFLRLRSLGARTKRHSGANDSAKPRLGIDGKLPMDQLQPFPHAGEAQPVPPHCLFAVKTNARIAHAQLDFVRCASEPHFEPPWSAMLDGILQTFLQDPKEPKRDLLPQFLRYAPGVKVNLHSMLVG